jgi:hypothetical protein
LQKLATTTTRKTLYQRVAAFREDQQGLPKMPIFDPDFCQSRCPICTAARKGNRLARFLQRVEMLLTLGGCPWGRARQAKYGVPPDQPLPGDPDPGGSPDETTSDQRRRS